MTRERNYKKLLYLLLTLLLLVLTIIGGRGIFPAFAETTSYSSALEDLQKDSTFNVNNYPDKSNDFSIQVIQIAEGVNDELFVYTYQPCQKTQYLVATEINMSLSETADGTKLYSLAMVSCSDVFVKYLVKLVKVSESATRYYNITSIYRTWDKTIDSGTGNDNTKNAVSFKVGKCYKATTENGVVKYQCKESETIEVTDKYVDFIRYSNRWLTYDNSTDSHYVAFSTDKPIDKLVEADVYFVSQQFRYRYNLFINDYKEVYAWDSEYHTVSLNYERDFGGNTASGLFSKKYEWQCVQSVSEFKASAKSDGITLSNETETNLKNKQWVLRFYESEYDVIENEMFVTKVSDVTILRLKFETDGVVYNLGVVDNKQTGDDVPGNVVIAGDDENSSNGFIKFLNYVWNCVVKLFTRKTNAIETVVAVIAIIVALGVFACAVAFIKWFIRKVFK